MFQFLARVERHQVGGEVIAVSLELFKPDMVLRPKDGDEFVTLELSTNPFDV